MELNSKNVKKILLIILFGVVAFAAVQNLNYIARFIAKLIAVFNPVITALCIAFVLNVLLNALEKKVFKFMDKKEGFAKKLKRPLCLTLTYLIALGIVALVIGVIIPDVANTVISLAEKLPSFMANAREWTENALSRFSSSEELIPDIKINWSSLAGTLKDFFARYSNSIFGNAVNITTSVFSGVYQTFFSFLISVYILAQKERIGGFTVRCIDAFVPKKAAKAIYHVAAMTYDSFSRFISGQLTESVILGVLCFIGMTVFRFPNAAVISVFICATSLVPVIGATVGVVTGFLLILIVSPLKAILFCVFFAVLQQLENSLIYPRVVGKSVGLPGVIVVCSVLVGGNIGGIVGALTSVPAAAVLFVLLKEAVAARTKPQAAPDLKEENELCAK